MAKRINSTVEKRTNNTQAIIDAAISEEMDGSTRNTNRVLTAALTIVKDPEWKPWRTKVTLWSKQTGQFSGPKSRGAFIAPLFQHCKKYQNAAGLVATMKGTAAAKTPEYRSLREQMRTAEQAVRRMAYAVAGIESLLAAKDETGKAKYDAKSLRIVEPSKGSSGAAFIGILDVRGEQSKLTYRELERVRPKAPSTKRGATKPLVENATISEILIALRTRIPDAESFGKFPVDTRADLATFALYIVNMFGTLRGARELADAYAERVKSEATKNAEANKAAAA